MATYNVLVRIEQTTDPEPKNWIVNTFHLDSEGTADDAMATEIATLWATFRDYPLGWDRVMVRMYDQAAPLPRPIVAQGEAAIATGGGNPGPREVALCLSYYREGRNLPRNRGRMYIGPWEQVHLGEVASTAVQGYLQALAEGLQTIGGTGTDWWQYSPTGQTGGSVTNWWVDNAWDTQRSRGLEASERITGTTSEG